MAARLLTLACVVHQASSFAAPRSRPAGVVVDELLADVGDVVAADQMLMTFVVDSSDT